MNDIDRPTIHSIIMDKVQMVFPSAEIGSRHGRDHVVTIHHEGEFLHYSAAKHFPEWLDVPPDIPALIARDIVESLCYEIMNPYEGE